MEGGNKAARAQEKERRWRKESDGRRLVGSTSCHRHFSFVFPFAAVCVCLSVCVCVWVCVSLPLFLLLPSLHLSHNPEPLCFLALLLACVRICMCIYTHRYLCAIVFVLALLCMCSRAWDHNIPANAHAAFFGSAPAILFRLGPGG